MTLLRAAATALLTLAMALFGPTSSALASAAADGSQTTPIYSSGHLHAPRGLACAFSERGPPTSDPVSGFSANQRGVGDVPILGFVCASHDELSAHDRTRPLVPNASSTPRLSDRSQRPGRISSAA